MPRRTRRPGSVSPWMAAGADSLNFRNFKATAERAILEKATPGTVRLTVQPNASDSAAYRAQ